MPEKWESSVNPDGLTGAFYLPYTRYRGTIYADIIMITITSGQSQDFYLP